MKTRKKNLTIILCLFLLALILIPLLPSPEARADLRDFIEGYQRREYRYVEEFYKAYYQNLYPDLESLVGRLNLLRWALKASWAPRHYALYFADTQEEHWQYQRLLATRIQLLLTKDFLDFAYYFYAPDVKLWSDACYLDAILQGYEVVEDAVDLSELHWEYTQKWALESWKNRSIYLDDSEMDKIMTEVYYIINREEFTEINHENLNVYEREPFLDYMFEERYAEIRENIAYNRERIKNYDYDASNCQWDIESYITSYFDD